MNVFDTLSRGLRMKARLPVLEQEVGTISKTIEQHRREMNASSLLFTENCSSSPGNAARERPPRLSSHFNSTSPIQAVTSPLGREVATDRIRTPEKRERMASPATVDIRTPVQRMSTQERRQSLQASILSRESMSPIQLPEKAEEFGQGYGKHATQDYPDLFKMMNNLNLGSTTVKEQEDAEVQRLKAMKERLNRSGEAKLKISPFVSVPRPFLPSFEPPLREFKVEEDEEEEEIEEDEYFGPAIEEIETFIDERLESGDDVLIEKFNIEIRHKDLKTLEGLNWLNDEIINFYFSLIMERSKIVENYPSVHVMNTFFYTTLTKKGFASVKRWTRKVDIFSMDFVLIPLHLGVHWTLCSVNNQKKRISYYDSMGGGRINQSGTKHLSVILNYLKEEYEDKKKSPLPTDYEANEVGVNDDGLENVRIPQQDNGSDCGVFTCKFAEYISRRATFTFSQVRNNKMR
jgi:sentrin-specific protease 1